MDEDEEIKKSNIVEKNYENIERCSIETRY